MGGGQAGEGVGVLGVEQEGGDEQGEEDASGGGEPFGYMKGFHWCLLRLVKDKKLKAGY